MNTRGTQLPQLGTGGVVLPSIHNVPEQMYIARADLLDLLDLIEHDETERANLEDLKQAGSSVVTYSHRQSALLINRLRRLVEAYEVDIGVIVREETERVIKEIKEQAEKPKDSLATRLFNNLFKKGNNV